MISSNGFIQIGFTIKHTGKSQEKKKKGEIEIGSPIAGTFTHTNHVTLDSSVTTNNDVWAFSFPNVWNKFITIYQGLPKEWQAVLESSGISKDDVQQYPEVCWHDQFL